MLPPGVWGEIIVSMMTPELIPAPLRTILRGAIDYAGLFPPASLSMPEAVENFARYHNSTERWALGRFVVAVSRLDEFGREAVGYFMGGRPAPHWQVSAVAAGNVTVELDQVRAFNQRYTPHLIVDAFEFKAASAGPIRATLPLLSGPFLRYVEIPVSIDPEPLVQAIKDAGGCAKIRTGGTTPELFPSPEQVLRMLAALAAHRVAFKATAGLHHSLRGSYPLTYAPESACTAMFGYLNVLLTSALLLNGGSPEVAQALLVERDPHTLGVDDTQLTWRDERWSAALLETTRQQLFHGFGSCSFREPMDDLLGVGAS